MALSAFTMGVKSRQIRMRLRIAMMLGLLLLVTGAAAVSAASATFPDVGRASHTGAPVGVAAGQLWTFSIPTGGLAPGETVRSREFVVNSERMSVRYSLTSASTDDDRKGLRDVLRVTIKTADLGSASAATCQNFDGPTLYDGPLGAGTAGLGDVRMGAQPGDRLLGAGQSETLCVEIGMPLDAGNEFQGAITSTTWTIVVEQEAGNA
jgi:hypothetical protein